MKHLKLFFASVIAIFCLMVTSQAAINKIKNREGFRATAYADGKDASGNQLYSIGYGHQIRSYELHLKTETITKAKGDQLLKGDVSPLELQINAKVKSGFTQNNFDACIDFGYNCGSVPLGKILETWVTTHNPKAVTDHMLLYNKTHDNKTGKTIVSNELTARRKENVLTFNNPVPPAVKTVLIAAVSLCLAAYALS